jgi:predicted metal-dependent hydrolase
VSKKHELKHDRILAMAEQFTGHGVDARFAGYFILFNQQKFYEAHDVLEDLWLPDRQGPNGHFYKGLIQLAGAFVHLQKNRLRPSAALFKLAQANLKRYPARHEKVDLAAVHSLIRQWLAALEGRDFTVNPLGAERVPRIDLMLGE